MWHAPTSIHGLEFTGCGCTVRARLRALLVLLATQLLRRRRSSAETLLWADALTPWRPPPAHPHAAPPAGATRASPPLCTSVPPLLRRLTPLPPPNATTEHVCDAINLPLTPSVFIKSCDSAHSQAGYFISLVDLFEVRVGD